MKFAIYSRKSKTTDKGESIGNQVEMCKSYINANDPGEEHEFLIYEEMQTPTLIQTGSIYRATEA